MIVWLPALSEETTRTATPFPLRVPGPRVFVPSKNVTVPVGVPPPEPVTVAVKVAAFPTMEGFGEELSATEVDKPLITCDSAVEVLTAKIELPLYFAVIEWVPIASEDVVKVATAEPGALELKFVVASEVVPSRNVTVPVGVPPELLTVAVNVTDWPPADGLAEETSAVAVGIAFTVSVIAEEVTELKFASPLYSTVIECRPTDSDVVVTEADTPTSVAVKSTVLPSKDVLPSRNVTVPVGVPPDPLLLTVAVNVTDWVACDGLSEETTVAMAALPLTTCVTTVEVVDPKFASPSYCAVIEWEPMLREEVAKVAAPALNAVVPSVVVPS